MATLETPLVRPCGGVFDASSLSRAQRRRFRLRRTAVLKSKLASSHVTALVLGGLKDARVAPSPTATEHVLNRLDVLDAKLDQATSMLWSAMPSSQIAWSPQGLVFLDQYGAV